jgi:hypothetical protein
MEDPGIFYSHLVNFPTIWHVLLRYIWYFLWSFGIHFHPVWYIVTQKIWQPWSVVVGSLKIFDTHEEPLFH